MLIPRQKKGGHGGGPDSLAWMMSYADMATILLAMFIVLSTFAKDQTGISLYYGTGSFRAAVTSFGLPGLTPNSDNAVPLKAPGPQHTLPSQDPDGPDAPEQQSARDAERSPGKAGPDSPRRVIDVEEENFQRFLGEVGRHFPAEKLPRTAGRVAVDFYDPLGPAPNFLTAAQRQQVAPLLSLLQKPGYRMQVVVWAGIPRDTATARSAEQAADVAAGLGAGLDPEAQRRLFGVGQSWPYRDTRRPVMSVIVTRSEAAKR